MEIFFDVGRRRGGRDAEQFVISGFTGEFEEGADFFFKFFRVMRVFGDGRGFGFRFSSRHRAF